MLSEQCFPPSSNDFFKINADGFFKNNRDTDQESILTDGMAFKMSATRFVEYLSRMKTDCEFQEIFYPEVISINEQSMEEMESKRLVQWKSK